jgi:RNase adaptor protein for sRNA GlmZ degradation
MGIPILILGASGSGKSTSLRNFDPKEIGIFNVASKPLPFKKKLPKVDNATYTTIYKGLAEPKLKKYVIDDSQYLMAFE